MLQDSPPSGGLAVLAEAFRARRTGVLVVGRGTGAIHVRLEAGQIVAIGPATGDGTRPPKPGDSVKLRLERVLAEIGMSKPAPPRAEPASPDSLRDRLIEGLADPTHDSRFEDGAEAPQDLVSVPLATEPLILEAVRQLRHDDSVRQALGDLDRRLVATAALADERTLTLTEGYLLSRIDGLVSLRDVLELAPLDPQEAERALLGLLLTGRVECKPAEAKATPPARPYPPSAEETPAEAQATQAPREDVVAEAVADDEPPAVEAVPDDGAVESPAAAAAPPAAPDPPPAKVERPPLDPATIQRRREILEFFQALPLQNHFQVLGVEPGCSDAEVRRGYVALTKRYHPDAQRHAGLADMQDIMEAIFIRVGEAWEVLGEARSRASYEARSGIVRRPRTVKNEPAGASADGGPQASSAAASMPLDPVSREPRGYVPPEEILIDARRLLTQARYWDAIQMLESAIPAMEPRAQQHRGRLLLARAYSKNPNWLRRAEETLQQVLREDPTNAEVHYELGLIYKSGGFVARAQSMFRRALELRPGHKDASYQLELLGGGVPSDAQGSGLLKRLFKRGGPP
jgi:tetratricopeptide (TPR) repeat protein